MYEIAVVAVLMPSAGGIVDPFANPSRTTDSQPELPQVCAVVLGSHANIAVVVLAGQAASLAETELVGDWELHEVLPASAVFQRQAKLYEVEVSSCSD